MAKQVQFEFDLDAGKYQRTMQAAIRTGAQMDAQMRQLQKTANDLRKALDKIGGNIDLKISADVNTGGIKSDIESISPVVDVRGDVNETAIKGDIEAIDATAAVKGAVNDTQIKGDISGITGEAEVRGDVNETAIKGDISSITGEAKVKGDVDLSDIRQQIEGLQATATVSLVLQGAAQGRELLNQTPIVGDLNDRQTAENTLQASRTGLDVAEGMAAVGAVWAQNWGASRTEIAGVVKQVEALAGADEDLGDAATAIYELTAGGKDLETVLRATSVLVTTGVAGSFREAADMIATGLNDSAGTAEDFFDTISEYAPQLQEIGTSGEGFIAFLNEGIAAGAWNTDKLADSFKEANVRIQEAVAMAEGPAFEALSRVGQTDEAQAFAAGEITAGQFFEGLTSAIETEGSDFDLFEIFGSGAEDLGATVFQGIDWTSLDAGPMVEGAAAEYGTIMTDSIGADWATLMRTLDEGFIGVVDKMTGGIDGWVAETRTKIQTLSAELRSGTGLPEALEIALEMPGLADKIRDFEASVGNFVIELQLVVASVLEFLGKGDAATGIRTAVADQAENQLAYEVKFADNEEEIAASITRAMERGVEDAGISAAIEAATLELIAEEDVTRAQEIVDILSGVQVRPGSEGVTLPGMGGVSLIPEDLMNTIMADVPATPIDFTAAQAAVDQAVIDAQEIHTLKTAWDVLTSLTGDLVMTSDVGTGKQGLGFENLIDFTAADGEILRFKDATLLNLNDTTTGVTLAVDTMQTDTEAAFGEMAHASDVSTAQVNAASDLLLLELQTNTEGIISEINAQRDAYLELGQAAYDAWVAGGMVGPAPATPPGRAGGGDVSRGRPYIVGERGEELFVPGMDGAIIPHQLTTLLMQLPAMGGGNSSIVNNTSIVVNTNINSQGTAQLMGGAGRLARSIRGMG